MTSRGMPKNWFSCWRKNETWKFGLTASRTLSSVVLPPPAWKSDPVQVKSDCEPTSDPISALG
jgi:hypothetical protein